MYKSGFTNGRNAKGAGNDAIWCVLQHDDQLGAAALLCFDSPAAKQSYLTTHPQTSVWRSHSKVSVTMHSGLIY